MPSITIEIDDATASSIDELADATDQTPGQIAKAAIQGYLQANVEWVQRIEDSRAQILRGEGVPHEQVRARFRDKVDGLQGAGEN